MKWISFIIEIAACIISFGICTAVIRAQFRPKDELSWWKYLVFGITFTAVTYFEVGSNLIASFLEWEYVFFLPGDILKDGLLQKSSLLL